MIEIFSNLKIYIAKMVNEASRTKNKMKPNPKFGLDIETDEGIC